MRVTVDADTCQGHARCWQICPQVFDRSTTKVTSRDRSPRCRGAFEAKVREAVATTVPNAPFTLT